MGVRVVLYACILGLCSCTAAQGNKDRVSDIANEKKYAVAYCLSKIYPGSEFSSDSKHIAGSYIQKGRFGIHVYESIRNDVDTYRGKKYVSKHEINLDIMQCLDLYNSNSLEAVIRKSANADD